MGKNVVVRHLDSCELDVLIKNELDRRVCVRLVFIKCLYEGDKVEMAVKKVGRARMTGYYWLMRWNRFGYEGLKHARVSGRPSKLDEVQRMYLEMILVGRDDWLLDEIKELVRVLFNVIYCDSWIREVLRGMGMRHAKPYSMDYRRPADADMVLKKALIFC
jgi:putative transposase